MNVFKFELMQINLLVSDWSFILFLHCKIACFEKKFSLFSQQQTRDLIFAKKFYSNQTEMDVSLPTFSILHFQFLNFLMQLWSNVWCYCYCLNGFPLFSCLHLCHGRLPLLLPTVWFIRNSTKQIQTGSTNKINHQPSI